MSAKPNILFFGSIASVHDFKWAKTLSQKANLFFISDTSTEALKGRNIREKLYKENVKVLDPLPDFSVTKPAQLLKGKKHLKQIIKKHNIQAVHISFLTPYALWTRYIDIPFILTSRGSDVLKVIPELATKGGFASKQKEGILKKLFIKAINKAEVITSTSSEQIKAIKSYASPKETQLIRTGVEVDKIENMVPSNHLPEVLKNKKIIFSPRWIGPLYNTQIQVEAIQLLPLEILNDYHFVFMKHANDNSDYTLKIEQSLAAINDLNYTLLENVSLEEMYSIYRSCSLSMMTPLSDGTPNSALESMAAKCPLIVSDLEYDEVLFKDTCLKLNPSTPEKLKELIEHSITQYSNTMLELGSKQTKEHGNHEVEMDKIIALYQRITL